jgi:hypothetical protein
LLERAMTLEKFAYSTPERNRLWGGSAHNSTVQYLYNTIAALNDYYTVEYQPFVEIHYNGTAAVSVNGTDQHALPLTYSPPGKINQPLVVVANEGCNIVRASSFVYSANLQTDYPATVAGKIALISRGTCYFEVKSSLAEQAGAAGAIIYNNVEGALQGSLSSPLNTKDRYVPTAGISLANGTAIKTAINAGGTIMGVLDITSVFENRTT